MVFLTRAEYRLLIVLVFIDNKQQITNNKQLNHLELATNAHTTRDRRLQPSTDSDSSSHYRNYRFSYLYTLIITGNFQYGSFLPTCWSTNTIHSISPTQWRSDLDNPLYYTNRWRNLDESGSDFSQRTDLDALSIPLHSTLISWHMKGKGSEDVQIIQGDNGHLNEIPAVIAVLNCVWDAGA